MVVGVLDATAAARPSQVSPAPAGDWARSVCGALINWRDSVENAAADTTNETQGTRGLSDSARVKRAKQAMASFLGVAVDATTATASSVRAVGAPGVASSAEVQDAVLASFDELVGVYQSSAERARRVSTKNPKRADRQLSSIAEAVGSQSEELESQMDVAIDKDTSGELRGAVAAEPQCADVLGDLT
jgi:hypothetical protein